MNEVQWHTLSPDDFEGRGWKDTESPFDRVPAKVKDTLPEVWKNGHSSAGMCAHFTTDSTRIRIRYHLASEQLGEPNFNVAAFSGTALYVHDPRQKRWRWAAATPHFVLKDRNPNYPLLEGLPRKERRYRLYLPFRNQISDIAVGIDENARWAVTPPRTDPPLVYYGTSLIHGAFVTRPGLGPAQIAARELDLPLVNMGFSGSARLEADMARLLAELDARIYVVDAYHNLTPELIEERMAPFLHELCSRRPGTPVLFLGAPPVLNAWLKPERLREDERKIFLMGRIARKMKQRYANLHYLKGTNFYGSDDVSIDGIHVNDSAFDHMAKILIRKIRTILDDGRR